MSILGSAPGIIVGTGVGAAAAAALEPAIEVPRQNAWVDNPARVLEAELIARLVAQGGIALDATAYDQASRSGWNADRLDAMVFLEQHVPGWAQLLFLWRLGIVKQADLEKALTKQGMRQDWIDALVQLEVVPLTAEQVAIAVQRSLIPDQGQLPSSESDAQKAVYALWDAMHKAQLGTDAPTGNTITPMPVTNLDAYASAAAYGVGNAELDVLTRTVGLPIAPEQAARLLFRDYLTADDVARALAEGNSRIEWAPAFVEAFRQILTAHDAAELELRGFFSRDERLKRTLKHGMDEADSDALYDLLGRSIPVKQVLTGEQRGGTFEGDSSKIPPAYLQSLQRGNLRPEYYSLAYANRHTYPSAFVFRQLLTDGVIDEAQGEQYLLELGWPPELATLTAQAYSTGTSAKAKQLTKAELADEYAGGYITQAEYSTALQALGFTGAQLALELQLGDAQQAKRWREKVVEAIHSAYLAFELDDTQATSELATVAVTGELATKLLGLWQLERSYTRHRLTQAQVVKAFVKGLITQADALARLADFGLSAADAQVRLEEG